MARLAVGKTSSGLRRGDFGAFNAAPRGSDEHVRAAVVEAAFDAPGFAFALEGKGAVEVDSVAE
jgi:hypothetical protein